MLVAKKEEQYQVCPIHSCSLMNRVIINMGIKIIVWYKVRENWTG